MPVLINKLPVTTRNKEVGCRMLTAYLINKFVQEATYCMYGSISVRLVNTYIMIVSHSSFFNNNEVASLALPSCPWKRLSFDSFSPAL